jgi:hypothetical protein
VRRLSPDDVAALTDEELADVHTLLLEAEHDHVDSLCAQEMASFEAGPLYWATTHTATENPHWQEQGLPFIAPFPKKSYFTPLFAAMLRERRLFIPKSREMITSWAVCVYAMHRAQWSQAEVVIQTTKEEKARRLVEYSTILYRNQPEWLRKRHPLKRDATALAMAWADGGRLYGIPSGEDQIRMFHPTIVIFDEAAFLPGFEASYDAAEPVAKQLIAISSAGPGPFADICSR